jgi:hypothetical protein
VSPGAVTADSLLGICPLVCPGARITASGSRNFPVVCPGAVMADSGAVVCPGAVMANSGAVVCPGIGSHDNSGSGAEIGPAAVPDCTLGFARNWLRPLLPQLQSSTCRPQLSHLFRPKGREFEVDLESGVTRFPLIRVLRPFVTKALFFVIVIGNCDCFMVSLLYPGGLSSIVL